MPPQASDEQVYYMWKCHKCGTTHGEEVLFCTRCAATEGATNEASALTDKVGKITEAMMGAIGWSLQHAQLKTADVLAQATKRGYSVSILEDLQALSLSELDQLAGNYTAMNRAGATGTGFTAGLPGGLAGFVAIPADISAVIYFSLRCLSGISQTYSFETASDTGQTIQLLALAQACRMETVIIGAKRLENFELARYLLQNPAPYSALAKACVLKQLASYLAIDFAKTSWATFLPVVGGVVNGTNNFFFLGDVNNRGKQFYHNLLLAIKPDIALTPSPKPKPAQLSAQPRVLTIEVREIKLTLPGGDLKARIICADQSETAETLSLVLVLWEGSTGSDLAERLAENGFTALWPASSVSAAQLNALLNYLTENKLEFAPSNLAQGKPKLLTFGKGAAVALEMLAETPDALGRTVLYSPVGESREIITNVPILLLWGENDKTVATDWPEKLRPRDHIGLISCTGYSGVGHDFANPASPEYHRKAAQWAWSDTLDWLTSENSNTRT